MDTKKKKKTKNFAIIKFICSYNGAYNLFIEKKIFSQPNKNLMPLNGVYNLI